MKGHFYKTTMDLYLISTPWWLRKLFPGCVWDVQTKDKTIYLTFDDGPHPAITPFVLEQLEKYNAKATFFCIGDNVRKYPGTYEQVMAAGHSTGNHTMHHLNGWHTADAMYLADIAAAGTYIRSSLFRPPYGRIRHSQVKKIKTADPAAQIIMWSVLAGDWDAGITPQKCFKRVCKSVYPGCIVVFHDSEKAEQRLRYVLPQVLQHFSKLGYRFCAL